MELLLLVSMGLITIASIIGLLFSLYLTHEVICDNEELLRKLEDKE